MSLKKKITVVVGSFVLIGVVLAGVATASNMGFKLNYGIVNAINQLLYGSGVSINVVHDDATQPPVMAINVDPDSQSPSVANSNMGFKLNIMSLPPGGSVPIELPNGASWIIKWDGNSYSIVAP